MGVTHGVVLSRAAGRWGAECGANEHGVVAGCGVASVRQGASDGGDGGNDGKGLIGADLVR